VDPVSRPGLLTTWLYNWLTRLSSRVHSDGEGFLVVYSVCSRDTFERVEQIVKRVRRVKEEAATMGGAYGSYPYSPQSPQSPLGVRAHGPIPIVIIGNKRDMQHLRDVQPEEGANLARRLGCEFYETSAKHGYNAFKTAVRGIKVAKGIAPGQGPAGPGGPGGPGQAGRRRQKRNKNCVVL
jgi:GTPase KRas protein